MLCVSLLGTSSAGLAGVWVTLGPVNWDLGRCGLLKSSLYLNSFYISRPLLESPLSVEVPLYFH